MSKELKELRNPKKLLILLLKSNKVKEEEIAKVLGIDRTRVSHMLNPKGEKSAKRSREKEG